MTDFTRHCQSAPDRKCNKVPQCVLDCDFDVGEMPSYLLPDPPEWQNEPSEIDMKWLWIAVLAVACAAFVAWVVT